MIGNCRNDGGIIATKFGSYIVSIFINNFNDYYWNRDNKAIFERVKRWDEIYSKISKLYKKEESRNNEKCI